MTRLNELFEAQGQSPWIDNLTRDGISGGRLKSLVAQGIRGVTSNPTIFQKAMSAGDAYDEQFRKLAGNMSTEDAYWAMVCDDIRGALAILRPVYDASDGNDGFVSLEVSPAMAADTQATISAARRLHEDIDRPNLMVKIPATPEGIPAVRQMLAEGRSINITLIFSVERYGEVIEAYLTALEALAEEGRDLSRVASVASFFISRVDTEVDRRTRPDRNRGSRRLEGQGRRCSSPSGLRTVPPEVQRRSLGRAGGQGSQIAAAAVGVDVNQESGVRRPALRGQPDRPGHGEHDARRHR